MGGGVGWNCVPRRRATYTLDNGLESAPLNRKDVRENSLSLSRLRKTNYRLDKYTRNGSRRPPTRLARSWEDYARPSCLRSHRSQGPGIQCQSHTQRNIFPKGHCAPSKRGGYHANGRDRKEGRYWHTSRRD